MVKESVQTTVRVPVYLLGRLNELVASGKRRDFIREAIAEKLSRDFGENVESKLSRKNQGRRTDLEKLRLSREAAQKQRKTAESGFHKAKTERELVRKMSLASKEAVLEMNLFLREAEILATTSKKVSAALSDWRKATNQSELESRWVALCEAVNAA